MKKVGKKLPSVTLKYFQKLPNVGDQFSFLLAKEYFSPNVRSTGNELLKAPNLLLAGSILDWADAYSYVCGAGFISRGRKVAHRPASIQCVRGPLTALALESQGIPAPSKIGDPGVLAPEVFPMTANEEIEIGIVPHYVDLGVTWLDKWRKRGIQILDPRDPPDQFLPKLQRCKIVFSSSLHGIIFAHAYGKPALWIVLSDRVIGQGFKFYDYYLSVGVSPERVIRHRVSSDTNPWNIASMAATADHTFLVSSVNSAIRETRRLMMESNREHPSS